MKRKNGFSMIELLVYISIFAISSVFFINAFLTVMKSLNILKVKKDINNGATMAMERMVSEIRLADSVNNSQSTLGSNPGQLALNTIERGTETVTTAKFYLSNFALMIQEGSATAQALTPPSVQVTNLVFREISLATSTSVKIEMSLRSQRKNYDKTEKFYNTAVLRRSYGE